MAIPRESWLRSDNHEKWATAMTMCQSSWPYCGTDGFCVFDGDCFRVRSKKVSDLEQRMTSLEQQVAELTLKLATTLETNK